MYKIRTNFNSVNWSEIELKFVKQTKTKIGLQSHKVVRKTKKEVHRLATAVKAL